MASLTGFPRLCVVVLLLTAGCVSSQNCSPQDPECGRSVGEAYAEPGPSSGRKMLQTPRYAAARLQSQAPHIANRRSLLQNYCSDDDNSAEAVIICTNAVRKNPNSFDYRCSFSTNSYGQLGDLDRDSSLMEAAQKHAEDNGRTGQLTHTGSDGSRVSDRVGRAGYSYSSVRENIAYGYTSAKDVVMGWMCSSGHRENIMSCDIADIGVGIAKGRDGRYYHAQVFGCPRNGRCTCAGGSGGGSSSEPSREEPRDEDPFGGTRPDEGEDPFGGSFPDEDKPMGEDPRGGSFPDEDKPMGEDPRGGSFPDEEKPPMGEEPFSGGDRPSGGFSDFRDYYRHRGHGGRRGHRGRRHGGEGGSGFPSFGGSEGGPGSFFGFPGTRSYRSDDARASSGRPRYSFFGK